MFKIHPTPTTSERLSLKHIFISEFRMSKLGKTAEKQTSKKEKNNFNFYGLVKGKIKVLLLFYFCSTFSYYTTILYNFKYYSILFYSILFYSFRRWFKYLMTSIFMSKMLEKSHGNASKTSLKRSQVHSILGSELHSQMLSITMLIMCL